MPCGSNYRNAKLECEAVEVRSARFCSYGCSMICRMGLQMCISLFLMISLSSLAFAIVPETSHLGNVDQPTFLRHFWSTSDKHHYRLSEDGEVAQIILDKQSGNPSDVGVWRGK